MHPPPLAGARENPLSYIAQACQPWAMLRLSLTPAPPPRSAASLPTRRRFFASRGSPRACVRD